MIKQHFIQQSGGSACILIAALNARIFYRAPVENAREGDSKFQQMAEKYHCLNGPCLCVDELLSELELEQQAIASDPEQIVSALKAGKCVQITMSTDRWNLHSALITNYIMEDWGYLFEVVNSQLHEPCTIEWLTWDDLSLEPALAYRKNHGGVSILSPKNCVKI